MMDINPADEKVAHAIAKARVRDGAKLFSAVRYDDGTVRIGWFVLREEFDGSRDWHWAKPVRVCATGAFCASTDVPGELVDEDVAHAACAFWDAKAHKLIQAPADGLEEDYAPLAEMCRSAVMDALCTGLSGRARGTWNGDVTGVEDT